MSAVHHPLVRAALVAGAAAAVYFGVQASGIFSKEDAREATSAVQGEVAKDMPEASKLIQDMRQKMGF